MSSHNKFNTSRAVPHSLDQTTPRKAVNAIRLAVDKVWETKIAHIYYFNVDPEQLELAYSSLEKVVGHKSMRVSGSDDYNFVVRYLPCRAHIWAYLCWNLLLSVGLQELTPPPHDSVMPPGCDIFGPRDFEFEVGMKQPDSSVRRFGATYPSIVLEIGDSESFAQLEIDAKFWLEGPPQVRLFIIVLLDPPTPPPDQNIAKIIVQLWRAVGVEGQRHSACMVWEDDWSDAASPLYILLSDIFGDEVPEEYGENDRVFVNTQGWRHDVLRGF